MTAFDRQATRSGARRGCTIIGCVAEARPGEGRAFCSALYILEWSFIEYLLSRTQQDAWPKPGRARARCSPGGRWEAHATAQSNTEARARGPRVGVMRAGPESARAEERLSASRRMAGSRDAERARGDNYEAESRALRGKEKKRKGPRAPHPNIRVGGKGRPGQPTPRWGGGRAGKCDTIGGYRPRPGPWGHKPGLEALAVLPWQLVGEERERAPAVAVSGTAGTWRAPHPRDGRRGRRPGRLARWSRSGQLSGAPRGPGGPCCAPGTCPWVGPGTDAAGSGHTDRWGPSAPGRRRQPCG